MGRSPDDRKIEFVVAQYEQLAELMRMHLQFSWQIPAIAVVAVVALVGLSPGALKGWQGAPVVPAVVLLAVSLFIAVLFLHHARNCYFASQYGRALVELERKYGEDLDSHAQAQARLRGWRRIPSSTALSVFLGVVSLLLMAASIYFFSRL